MHKGGFYLYMLIPDSKTIYYTCGALTLGSSRILLPEPLTYGSYNLKKYSPSHFFCKYILS